MASEPLPVWSTALRISTTATNNSLEEKFLAMLSKISLAKAYRLIFPSTSAGSARAGAAEAAEELEAAVV